MIGAPFYVMARLDGVVYDDVDAVDGITEAQGLAASYELVDVLGSGCTAPTTRRSVSASSVAPPGSSPAR